MGIIILTKDKSLVSTLKITERALPLSHGLIEIKLVATKV